MQKSYVIWWHSKFIDEINRETTTISDIVDKTCKTVKHLEKLKRLEDAGKIKVKTSSSLNPIFIEVIDHSIEGEVSRNPIVEVVEQ
jgi:hypothetical protein